MRRITVTVVSLAVVFVAGLAGSAPAFAVSPWWHLVSGPRPASLQPGGEGTLVLHALNVGDGPSSGPVTLSLTLPAGVTVKTSKKGVPQVFFKGPLAGPAGLELGPTGPDASLELCKASASQVTCTSRPEDPGLGFLSHVAPYEELEVRVAVDAEVGASSGEYGVEVSGGEAPVLSRHRPLTVSEAPPPFAAEELSLVPEEEGGAIDARAGSHPFQLTAGFYLNQTADPEHPPALPRNLHFKLPAGQVGNVNAVAKCTALQFSTLLIGDVNLCPSNTALGAASITIYEPIHLGVSTYSVPIFNLEPKYGEPARFGFIVLAVPVILDTAVRSGPGEDYGVTVSPENITEVSNFISSTVTFWGAPTDPRHDQSRGWSCIASGIYGTGTGPCSPSTQSKPAAFLTLPTNCAEPFATSVDGVSWPTPESPNGIPLPSAEYSLLDSSGSPLGLTGCNQLPFAPALEAEPSTDRASAPSGLNVNIDFHDEGLTSAEGLAQSELNKTVVILPEGFTINPSAGVGLGGCRPADYARETIDSLPGAGCPNNSKLGTVEIQSPLLTQKIQGSIFIAQPFENPSNSLVALYIVAKNPETGVLIKLAGKVTPNLLTGQLTTTFENNPQLPFDHFNFHFREGQQAPLITPSTCGTYETKAELTPWSEPLAPLTDSSSFTITKGFDGGGCPSGGVPPFHPGIQSGMLNNNAGAFSPFYLHLTRTDGEQEISGFSTNLPPGLTGDLSGIPFCPEAAIALARTKTGVQEEANPSCPASSQVGHTLVGTGVGAVLAYVPGKIYLAGPFHGAPFSLVAVTSAVVGPFDLGTVVLRFGLNIDPYTAQVNVSPTTSEPIPTILDGIVTHVRDIRVYIDRPNFTLNPTSCNPLAIASTLSSNLGASATITSPFQAASCANLKFAPKFAVSTQGKTSRANGASLHVELTYPSGPQGTYADIAKVKVELPKQLPSRLTTLQKACTAAQFEFNPAGCPSPSVIGTARAVVPNIPEPLIGPVYFVSHGGEAFPSLEIVLQGYGVKVILVGATFISKAGITSTTFKAIPDNPVSSFELTLPEGPYSALAANGNLCTQKLTMPSDFTGQNGMEADYKTPVSVSGCSTGIAIVSHKIKGRTLTVSVSVGAAGILTASGNGLSRSSKSAKGRETLTFRLTQKKPGKLKTKLKIAFKPSKGAKQAKSLSVKFKK
jgi:hypothetical protein